MGMSENELSIPCLDPQVLEQRCRRVAYIVNPYRTDTMLQANSVKRPQEVLRLDRPAGLRGDPNDESGRNPA